MYMYVHMCHQTRTHKEIKSLLRRHGPAIYIGMLKTQLVNIWLQPSKQ